MSQERFGSLAKGVHLDLSLEATALRLGPWMKLQVVLAQHLRSEALAELPPDIVLSLVLGRSCLTLL